MVVVVPDVDVIVVDDVVELPVAAVVDVVDEPAVLEVVELVVVIPVMFMPIR